MIIFYANDRDSDDECDHEDNKEIRSSCRFHDNDDDDDHVLFLFSSCI